MNTEVPIMRIFGLIIGCFLTIQCSCIAQTLKVTCGNDLLPATAQLPPKRLANLRLNATTDDTTTYTIPVVFLVYNLGEPIGTGSNISDASIQYMLDLINQRYAGIGINYVGQDSKIRFALAKRTPLCNSTTGIIRMDARSVPNYQDYGLRNYDGQMMFQLAALAPDFKNQAVNQGVVVINILHKVNIGAFANYGGAIYLTAPKPQDLSPYNYVPPHEMGHVLSLFHTYDGSQQKPGGDPYDYTCPSDTYNDGVEDTQPTRLYDPLYACSPGADQLINVCTGLPFGTSLRNLMNYGCNQDRFTPGQIARMRSFLANEYKKLANSGLDRPSKPNEVILPVTNYIFLPQPPAGYYQAEGINRVQLAEIDNSTGSYPAGQYQDYSCINYAQVTVGQSYSLSVNGLGTFGRAYIDYNNDGFFNESNELVMSFATNNNNESFTASQQITIPSTAILNQKLRMRIVLDCGSTPPTAYYLPGDPSRGSGEVEDYGIMISTPSCTTLKAGLWNDSSIWSCGRLPQSTDVVYLRHSVTLPQNYLATVSKLIVESPVQLVYEADSHLLLNND